MIQQLLHQLVSLGLLLGVEGDRRCDLDSRLISICLEPITLFLDHLVRHLLADFRHKSRLTVIEVVVKQAQVLLVLLLHRVQHPCLAYLNPNLVLFLCLLFFLSLFTLGGRAWVFIAWLLIDHAYLDKRVGGFSLRILLIITVIIFGRQ